MKDDEAVEVVRQISERHWSWFKHFRRWRGTYWACGIVAAAASALAASRVLDKASAYFALLSSVSIAVMGFTNPQRRANAYVAAWRMVSVALLRYEAGQSTVAELISAVDRGEAHIGEMDTLEAGQSRRHMAGNETASSHKSIG
jgi:uncharacterized protein (DUF1501 family)